MFLQYLVVASSLCTFDRILEKLKNNNTRRSQLDDELSILLIKLLYDSVTHLAIIVSSVC